MLEQLDSYDWAASFGEPSGYTAACSQDVEAIGSVSTDSFSRDDVEEILAIEEGENDGDSWTGLFKLKDGRFAAVSAWCDYTGWG